MNRKSRLKRRLERKTQKNLVLGIIGICFILFILIRFGIPALANFALFLSGVNSNNKITANSEKIFIASPFIESQFSSTNSAQMHISGKSVKDATLVLYVNNREQDSFKTEKDGSFFAKVSLDEGNNTIKVKSQTSKGFSDFSNIITVNYIKSMPTLTISSPANGDSFSKEHDKVTVSGKTDMGATVTVNGLWAIIDDQNNFSYDLPLKNGENQITIIAADPAGNKTEKTIKVNYSQ
jgi:hypothetical protein